MLRNAEACRANSLSLQPRHVRYSFVDSAGEYYGVYACRFPFVRSPKLGSLVLYDVQKPQTNKIAIGCLFHRPVIIGYGLTELDEATVAPQISPAEAES